MTRHAGLASVDRFKGFVLLEPFETLGPALTRHAMSP